VGAGQIHLLELPDTNRRAALPEHGGRDRHVALNVTDLDAVVTALAAAGISYTLSRSGRRALFCRDPDGNAIELIEVPGGLQV
jgi:glyoxylase I family protein